MGILPEWLNVSFAAIFGAAIGSFINAMAFRAAWRFARAKSGRADADNNYRPGVRSSCPCCAKEIAWYDNIPILSWCWLRGRCRACQGQIPLMYWIAEIAPALIFSIAEASHVPLLAVPATALLFFALFVHYSRSCATAH